MQSFVCGKSLPSWKIVCTPFPARGKAFSAFTQLLCLTIPSPQPPIACIVQKHFDARCRPPPGVSGFGVIFFGAAAPSTCSRTCLYQPGAGYKLAARIAVHQSTPNDRGALEMRRLVLRFMSSCLWKELEGAQRGLHSVGKRKGLARKHLTWPRPETHPSSTS